MELKKSKDVDNLVPHYKIFPGRSTFCCDGRLQTSKNWLMIPFVLALIAIPSILHAIFDAPYLAQEHGALAVPLIGALIFALTVIMYFVTAFTDPGYVPRSTPEETIQTEAENGITVDLSGAYYPTPKLKVIDLKGVDYDSKFCTTCKFYRPPRTVHCSTCNMCVERFDHHCPFVSNCVGGRNYRYFYLFLVFGALLGIYGIAASAAAFGLRIRDIQPVGEAFKNSVVSIIVGVYSFFLGLNLVGMAGAHTSYTCFEKTTNERIKSRFKTRSGEMINPFAQRNMLMNFVYVICGPTKPKAIDYRAELPENYYTSMEVRTKELRMIRNKTTKNFIPIPSVYFFKETLKKFAKDCKEFREEFEFLTANYLKPKKENYIADLVVSESNPEGHLTNELLKNDKVEFLYLGYDEAKRYLSVDLTSIKPAIYWEFVFEYKVNNILLLENIDSQRQTDFDFITKPQTSFHSETGLKVLYYSTYLFTNFDIIEFHISSTKQAASKGSQETNKSSVHVVRVYRFWTYDSANNLPIESAYFIKMMRAINFHNPVFKKASKFNRIGYPKEEASVANYLMHADNPLKSFTFILFDQVSDQFRLTDRFCIENSFKKIKKEHVTKNKLFEMQLEQKDLQMSMDAYLFAYINSMNTVNTFNDIELASFDSHYKNISKIGYVTKKAITHDHLASMLKAAYVDRFLRSAFTKGRPAPDQKNFYTFSLYSPYDLTGMVDQSMEPDVLLSYAVKNGIDVVISINQAKNEFSVNTDRVQITESIESRTNKYTDMTVKDISYTTNRGPSKYKLRHAIVHNLQLKQVSSTDSLPGTTEYTKESVDTLSWLILKVLNSPSYKSKRVVLVADSQKTASILLISLINFLQAKQENSMNVNQAGQTVLSKLPRENSQYLPHFSSIVNNSDYESFYKSIFSIADYDLVYQVAVSISQKMEALKEEETRNDTLSTPI